MDDHYLKMKSILKEAKETEKILRLTRKKISWIFGSGLVVGALGLRLTQWLLGGA